MSKDVAALAAEKGHEVYLITRGNKSREIFINDVYHMIYGNIRDEKIREKLLPLGTFDVVIDFLSFVPEQLRTSLRIVKSLYKQYIFISTATVYKKKTETEIISEDTTELGNNKWDYAYQKYQCELLLEDYFRDAKDTFYTIIRPYVTYGNTRVPYPIVPSPQKEWSFVQRILENKSLPVFDGGTTITTLTHTKDFAKGVVGLLMNGKARNEAFHITNSNTVTWGEVLDALELAVGKKTNRIEFTQEQIYNTLPQYKSILVGDKGNTMCFDNSKICEAVPDFSCEVGLKEGIQDMVSFYSSNPMLKVIDYRWDGEIDRLCCKKGIRERMLKAHGYKDHIYYFIGRHAFADKAAAHFHK